MTDDFFSSAYKECPDKCSDTRQLLNKYYDPFHVEYTYKYIQADDYSVYGVYNEEHECHCELCGWSSSRHGKTGMYLHRVYDNNLKRYIHVGGTCLNFIKYKDSTLARYATHKNYDYSLLFTATKFEVPVKLTLDMVFEHKTAFLYNNIYYLPYACISELNAPEKDKFKLFTKQKYIEKISEYILIIKWLCGYRMRKSTNNRIYTSKKNFTRYYKLNKTEFDILNIIYDFYKRYGV